MSLGVSDIWHRPQDQRGMNEGSLIKMFFLHLEQAAVDKIVLVRYEMQVINTGRSQQQCVLSI